MTTRPVASNLLPWPIGLEQLEQTPLYIACDRNLVAITTWLVTHGADVNRAAKVRETLRFMDFTARLTAYCGCENQAGVSPLLCAYRNQNRELVTLLLQHGAIALQPPKHFSCIKVPASLAQ